MSQANLKQQLSFDQSIFAENNSDVSDKLATIKALPEMQRARMAQFCYTKVHMRELGLLIAQTCEMNSLRVVFGSGADVIFKQSRAVDETLGALKNANGVRTSKGITLSLVSSLDEE